MLTVDSLAQEIRRVDGNHSLGAGALAEALMPFLAALAEQTQQGVEVKKLEWFKPDPRNSLSRAENDLGVYRTWTHFEANGRWFWSLDGYEKASGERASEDDAKAAAQSDYDTRIRSALKSEVAG